MICGIVLLLFVVVVTSWILCYIKQKRKQDTNPAVQSQEMQERSRLDSHSNRQESAYYESIDSIRRAMSSPHTMSSNINANQKAVRQVGNTDAAKQRHLQQSSNVTPWMESCGECLKASTEGVEVCNQDADSSRYYSVVNQNGDYNIQFDLRGARNLQAISVISSCDSEHEYI